jgi:hypothetical protein
MWRIKLLNVEDISRPVTVHYTGKIRTEGRKAYPVYHMSSLDPPVKLYRDEKTAERMAKRLTAGDSNIIDYELEEVDYVENKVTDCRRPQ